MITENDLEKAIINKDIKNTVKSIKSICKNNLGYSLIKSCSCDEKTQSYLKKGKNREEMEFMEYVDCFHYGNKPSFWQRRREKEGIIFVFESFKEIGGVRGAINEGYKRGFKYGKKIKRQNMGLIGFFKGLRQEHKNILNKIRTVFGSVNCYVYGKRWYGYDGREEKTDFECQPNKSWGRTLKTPSVIKSVNIEKIMERISG